MDKVSNLYGQIVLLAPQYNAMPRPHFGTKLGPANANTLPARPHTNAAYLPVRIKLHRHKRIEALMLALAR